MKRHLLLALISLLALNVHAERYLVENYLGINCIEYKVKSNETLYNVAQQFFVRPSTLALVNNIKVVEDVIEGRRMYIPLTETNFYTVTGLESSEFTFSPIVYKKRRDENWQDIGYQFFVSTESLKKWNTTKEQIANGNTVVVGWLKHQLVVTEEETPRFVRKEKIAFGNEAEKFEARNKEYADASTSLAKPDLKNYDVSKDALPKAKVVSVKKKKTPLKRVAKKVKAANKTVKANKKELKVAKTTNNEELKISDAERQFLSAKKKEPKMKRKSGLLKKVKKLTRNSYVREKGKSNSNRSAHVVTKRKKVVAAVIQDEEANSKKKAFISDIKSEAIKELVKTKKLENVSARKVDIEPEEKTAEVEEEKSKIDPTFVQNKMQRLTLMKSLKGRATFFFSESAGAKFYVYTNLAGKGSIIKLTNLNNKKYILAEVIGLLPEADRKRGYLVKISDNSRRILSTSSKSFSAKINY